MHILYFHQYFSTLRGAGGTRSYEMARRLVERGHEVTMVCGSDGTGDTGISGRFKHGRRRGIVDGIKRRGIEDKNVVMIPNGCDFGLCRRKKTVSIRRNLRRSLWVRMGLQTAWIRLWTQLKN